MLPPPIVPAPIVADWRMVQLSPISSPRDFAIVCQRLRLRAERGEWINGAIEISDVMPAT